MPTRAEQEAAKAAEAKLAAEQTKSVEKAATGKDEFTESDENKTILDGKSAEEIAENDKIQAAKTAAIEQEKSENSAALRKLDEAKEAIEAQSKDSLAKAEVAAKKVKMVKVQFIQAHSFTIGEEAHDAVKGDKLEVEPHVANKLVSRSIAYILG